MEDKSNLYRRGIRLIVVTKPVSMERLFTNAHDWWNFPSLMLHSLNYFQVTYGCGSLVGCRLWGYQSRTWLKGLGSSSNSSKLLFICPVVSDSLWSQGLQHARPLCPSPSPEVCPSLCSLSQWCHPAISSSDTHFSFCPQPFPSSGTFPISQLYASDDQNTGVSISASVLPTNIQDWFSLDWLAWFPCFPRDSQESSPAPQFKCINAWCSAFFMVQLSQSYMTTGKTIALSMWTSVGRGMPLLFKHCLGLS